MNIGSQLVICLVLLAPAAHAPGQEALPSPAETSSFGTPGFEIERVSWIGNVAHGRGVTVVNRFGSVRARFGGYEGQVEVFANVQHFADEGSRLVVETRESQAGVEVTVGYVPTGPLRGDPTTEAGALVTVPDPDQKKRADLVVYVPRGAPLSASTGDGLIDARGLESDVHASTVSGELSARKIDGELDFETDSGDVLVILERWNSARQHSFTSDSGGLSIVFGGEVNTVIRVATSGLISTDFSMEIDYQSDRRPIKRGEALVGKGSSVVAISSADGHIRTSRRPLARKARVRPETGR